VKEDKDTAHIPFILLSARRDMEVQTEGLNAGAEIYITKPFHVDYLKSSVRRLLERKESLREYFSSPLSLYTLEQGKLSDKEHKKFVNEILKIINKNIKDKDLSAHLIAEKMNIGLRSFYRKLEEADGINLTELINNCRLAKAVDLLAKTKLTIDEVVFQSGFTNRSTFYRAFSKKYNCTPTEYRKDRKAVSGNV
jgi:AraC-like DNA-binding protein